LETEIGLDNKPVNMSHKKKMKAVHYLEILSNFTDKSLEGEFANKQFGRLLVTTNFTKSHSSGPETMGLLHTTSGGLHKKSSVKTQEEK
jgi:hypothetical protein